MNLDDRISMFGNYDNYLDNLEKNKPVTEQWPALVLKILKISLSLKM